MAARDAPAPEITLTPDGRTARMTLKVLTYNIEGLGWPARSGRAGSLRQIGAHLKAWRASGDGPDVILFQEMFSGPAKRAVAATEYPAIATGPRRTTRPYNWSGTDARLPGKASIRRGEIGLHLTGSGLAIASRYPITTFRGGAFGRTSCAGIDCLSNKGIAHAQIMVPGLPTPIDLYNTHMNSTAASRVPVARHLAAHERQSLAVSEFIDRTHDDTNPIIFGGDFNMRHSEERWDNFSRYQSLKLVHQVCADARSDCRVKISWDGDAPWIDTQDLQFFWDCETVKVRPILVEAVFDGGDGGPRLSDHDGFMVTYALEWRMP